MFLRLRFIPKIPLLVPRSLSGAAGGGSDKCLPPAPLPPPVRDERYRQLENLDFMTAAKILFTEPPKKKKFGIDFHLVQFFFACMPSLAVYLVAQYARYEIRRMEAEVEQKKKKAEEEEKTKEEDLGSITDGSDTELSEVKSRLDALEEALKEIVDEKKKVSCMGSPKVHEGSSKGQVAHPGENSSSQIKSSSGDSTKCKGREAESHSSILSKTVAGDDGKERKSGNKETSDQK